MENAIEVEKLLDVVLIRAFYSRVAPNWKHTLDFSGDEYEEVDTEGIKRGLFTQKAVCLGEKYRQAEEALFVLRRALSTPDFFRDRTLTNPDIFKNPSGGITVPEELSDLIENGIFTDKAMDLHKVAYHLYGAINGVVSQSTEDENDETCFPLEYRETSYRLVNDGITRGFLTEGVWDGIHRSQGLNRLISVLSNCRLYDSSTERERKERRKQELLRLQSLYGLEIAPAASLDIDNYAGLLARVRKGLYSTLEKTAAAVKAEVPYFPDLREISDEVLSSYINAKLVRGILQEVAAGNRDPDSRYELLLYGPWMEMRYKTDKSSTEGIKPVVDRHENLTYRDMLNMGAEWGLWTQDAVDRSIESYNFLKPFRALQQYLEYPDKNLSELGPHIEMAAYLTAEDLRTILNDVRVVVKSGSKMDFCRFQATEFDRYLRQVTEAIQNLHIKGGLSDGMKKDLLITANLRPCLQALLGYATLEVARRRRDPILQVGVEQGLYTLNPFYCAGPSDY
ncbi:hypothetical protein JW930_06060 [Candidatus Woesearchaeota archaeon]|nr:hypothetical protein [Candidatus Woesearchaeota archaeon]